MIKIRLAIFSLNKCEDGLSLEDEQFSRIWEVKFEIWGVLGSA